MLGPRVQACVWGGGWWGGKGGIEDPELVNFTRVSAINFSI